MRLKRPACHLTMGREGKGFIVLPRWRIVAATVAALTVLASIITLTPAVAAPRPMADGITYVALGDSVAAGLGAGPIVDECGHTAGASFHPNALGQMNGYLPLMNMQFLS